MLVLALFCTAAGIASYALLGLLCAIMRGDQPLALRCIGTTALAALAGNFVALNILTKGGI